MATDKLPTKEEFLNALREKGINDLEDFVDVIFPETGGYRILFSDHSEPTHLTTIPEFGSFGVKWYLIDDDEGKFDGQPA